MAEHVYFLGDSNLNRMAKQILMKKISKTESGKNIYQLAISGQCSKGLAKQILNANLEKQTIILMIGTNDVLKRTNVKQYKKGLKYIFKQITNKNIILCTILPIPKLPHPNSLIGMYNAAIKSYSQYSNVTVIDVYSYFTLANNTIRKEYFEKDKLHLNKVGLTKLWNLIVEKI